MVIVPRLIVKLVAAERADTGALVGEMLLVLQVTLSFVPSESSSWMIMTLLAVTAVVFTWHVAPEAFVAQEKEPEDAAPHAATEGLAAVPATAQLVLVV